MNDKTVTITQSEYDELQKMKVQRNQFLTEFVLLKENKYEYNQLPDFFKKNKISKTLNDEELTSLFSQGNVFNCDPNMYHEFIEEILKSAIDKKWNKLFELLILKDDYSKIYPKLVLSAIEGNNIEILKIMFDKLDINPMPILGSHKQSTRRARKNDKTKKRNCYPLLVAIQNRNINAMKIIIKNKYVKVQDINWNVMAYIFETEFYADNREVKQDITVETTRAMVSAMMSKYQKDGPEFYNQKISDKTKKKVKEVLPKIDLAIGVLDGLY